MVSVASVSIRAATPDDLSACLAFDLSYETDYVWQVDVRGDESGAIAIGLRTARLPRLMRVTYPRTESLLSAALAWESATGAFMVAEKGGALRGYAILRFVRERDAAQIAELGVDAAARRQKIGTALLSAAYAQAQAAQTAPSFNRGTDEELSCHLLLRSGTAWSFAATTIYILPMAMWRFSSGKQCAYKAPVRIYRIAYD
jgi:ribosomal protein S18 acetylase RimI-like enzyme